MTDGPETKCVADVAEEIEQIIRAAGLPPQHWMLDGHTPRPATMMEWAPWFEKADRRVAEDVVNGVRVSTVFLGLNHQMRRAGPPILFDTMIFGGYYGGYLMRCCTWDQAETQHAELLARVRRLRLIPVWAQDCGLIVERHVFWAPLRLWRRHR